MHTHFCRWMLSVARWMWGVQRLARNIQHPTPNTQRPGFALTTAIALLLATNSAFAANQLRVLFLGDNGHHLPADRFKQLQPALAPKNIELVYTDQLEDLNPTKLAGFDCLVIYDGGKTRDERTRGMGGLLTSCGEENLLKLQKDRYRGRDICLHKFSHNVRNHGVQQLSATSSTTNGGGHWTKGFG